MQEQKRFFHRLPLVGAQPSLFVLIKYHPGSRRHTATGGSILGLRGEPEERKLFIYTASVSTIGFCIVWPMRVTKQRTSDDATVGTIAHECSKRLKLVLSSRSRMSSLLPGRRRRDPLPNTVLRRS
jgi:hypothetical protein